MSSHRLITLLAGFTAVGIALAVDDVLSALTCAYNLLVGGMLVPLLGAIYWRRATTPAAIASMLLGCGAAIVFMIKDGLDANTPIYVSLAVSLASLVVISLATRADAPASLDGARPGPGRLSFHQAGARHDFHARKLQRCASASAAPTRPRSTIRISAPSRPM